jgi:hypothetical protein
VINSFTGILYRLQYYCYDYYVYKPKEIEFLYVLQGSGFGNISCNYSEILLLATDVGAKRIGRILRAIITKPVLTYTSKNEDQLCKGVSINNLIGMLLF